MKWSTRTWEEEGWLRDQESLCLDFSVPWLGPFLGCLLVYKGRFLCLPFSTLEAHRGPHLGTEGTEVRCAWVKISFVTLGCSLSLGKFPFFYGVVMTIMALEGGCGVYEDSTRGHLVYLVLIQNMSWGRTNCQNRNRLQEWLSWGSTQGPELDP